MNIEIAGFDAEIVRGEISGDYLSATAINYLDDNLQPTEATPFFIKVLLDDGTSILARVFDESQHPRDDKGKWTDAGGSGDSDTSYEFVSPNVGNLSFSEAVSGLHSPRQEALNKASAEIDAGLKLSGSHSDIVGAWKDGAENSVLDKISNVKWTDWNRLSVSAAMKGWLADQKSVLVFQDLPQRKEPSSVAVETGRAPYHGAPATVQVEVNPSERDLRSLAKEGPVRILVDADGNFYAWDADKAIHAMVANNLGLDERHEDTWWIDKGKLVSQYYWKPGNESAMGPAATQAFRDAANEVRTKLASLQGNGVLLSFEAKGKLEDIHKNLLSDGLAFHSLVPHKDGATVYAVAVDPKEAKATVDNVEKAAKRYGSEIIYRHGRGEFIGNFSDAGSDREQRDAARSVYESHIRQTFLPGSEALWGRIRDSWAPTFASAKQIAKSYIRDADFFEREWDEGKHPRVPAGSSEGGQFGEGGGGSESESSGKVPGSNQPVWQHLTANTVKSETEAQKPRSRSVPVVAKEVNARANSVWKLMGVKSGKIEGPNPKTDAIIADTFVQEIKDGLSNGHADSEWYRNTMKEAMRIATVIHPEIATDPIKKFAFIVALAITSQGQRVSVGASKTEEAYVNFEKTGRFPTELDISKPSINENFAKLNKVLDRLGPVETVKFLDKRMPAGDLQALMNGRQPGSSPKGDKFKLSHIKVDTMVYGSAIFGPKIGEGFYQNLNGNFNPVTMDMWFMRTWGRITGTGIGTTAPNWDRLKNALKAEGKPVPHSEEKLLEVAREIERVNDRAFHKGEKTSADKSELDRAAERVVLNVDNGMVDEPRGGTQREWITKVFLSALDKLKAQGIDITPAGAQATIWNPEKVMYAHLGARVPEEADYAKVLRAIADAKGIAV